MAIIEFFKNIIFILSYIYFFINDIKCRKVSIEIFIIYASIGIMMIIIDYRNINLSFVVNTIFSMCFGLMILLFSYVSREAIGKGDCYFFIINGLYMCLNDNAMLFLTGLIVASIYGFYKYICYKKDRFDLSNLRVPFMPCLLPMVLWRVVCLL